jgi:hypothetical protein
MISVESLTLTHAQSIQTKHGLFCSPHIIQQTAHALKLLEILINEGYSLVFKGGTALMLSINNPIRMSVDIDISVKGDIGINPKKLMDITRGIFDKVEVYHPGDTSKFIEGLSSFILTSEENIKVKVDILVEENKYLNLEHRAVFHHFLIPDNSPHAIVTVPSLSSQLGDKLTAFAPNTLGVPFERKEDGSTNKGLEVVKQMHDVAALIKQPQINFDEAFITFQRFVQSQNAMRKTSFTTSEVLMDAFKTSLAVATHGYRPKDWSQNWDNYLHPGVEKQCNYILPRYNPEEAAIEASYVAWLAKTFLEIPDRLPDLLPKFDYQRARSPLVKRIRGGEKSKAIWQALESDYGQLD